MVDNFVYFIKFFIKGERYKEKLSDLDLIIASYIIAKNFAELSEMEYVTRYYLGFANPQSIDKYDLYEREHIAKNILMNTLDRLEKERIIKCTEFTTLEKYLTKEEKKKIGDFVCIEKIYMDYDYRKRCENAERSFLRNSIICYPAMDKKTFEIKYLSEYGISVDDISENLKYFLEKGEIRSAAEGIKKAKELKVFLNEIQK
ncbi:MAG: hypothetical protein QXO07_03265 [Candidatus Aenigmatarchaeota archaeon]